MFRRMLTGVVVVLSSLAMACREGHRRGADGHPAVPAPPATTAAFFQRKTVEPASSAPLTEDRLGELFGSEPAIFAPEFGIPALGTGTKAVEEARGPISAFTRTRLVRVRLQSNSTSLQSVELVLPVSAEVVRRVLSVRWGRGAAAGDEHTVWTNGGDRRVVLVGFGGSHPLRGLEDESWSEGALLTHERFVDAASTIGLGPSPALPFALPSAVGRHIGDIQRALGIALVRVDAYYHYLGVGVRGGIGPTRAFFRSRGDGIVEHVELVGDGDGEVLPSVLDGAYGVAPTSGTRTWWSRADARTPDAGGVEIRLELRGQGNFVVIADAVPEGARTRD